MGARREDILQCKTKKNGVDNPVLSYRLCDCALCVCVTTRFYPHDNALLFTFRCAFFCLLMHYLPLQKSASAFFLAM